MRHACSCRTLKISEEVYNAFLLEIVAACELGKYPSSLVVKGPVMFMRGRSTVSLLSISLIVSWARIGKYVEEGLRTGRYTWRVFRSSDWEGFWPTLPSLLVVDPVVNVLLLSLTVFPRNGGGTWNRGGSW